MKIKDAYINSHDKAYFDSDDLRVFCTAEVEMENYQGGVDFEFSYDPESGKIEELEIVSFDIDSCFDLDDGDLDLINEALQRYVVSGEFEGLVDLEEDEDE